MILIFLVKNKSIHHDIFNQSKMKKITLLTIVMLFYFLHVCAQKKSNNELKGDKLYFNYSFDKAINAYTHADQLSIDGQRRLAESYHKIDQDTQSERIYSILLNNAAGIIPMDFFNFAMVLKANGKYDESCKWMDMFKSLQPDDLRSKDYEANKIYLSIWLKDEGKYKIEHLNLNTSAEDFGTSYYKNNIVFASTRTSSKLIKRKYNWNNKPFLNMYISEIDKGQLKKPEFFDKSLNGKMHDGPATFSNDNTYMAFTRNDYNANIKDKVVELQIFFRSYKNNKWTKPIAFILNNKKYSVGQPCLSDDGNSMYFTSDMPGGYGGADIYKINKVSKDEWGKPENLGNVINTEGDEMFPFLDKVNGTFFFTSNGHFGLGGLDIFSCKVNGNTFGKVSNAGYPLNTQYDDFALIVNDKQTSGYFSSNRSGGNGDDDIYSINFLNEPVFGNSKVTFTVNSPKNIASERRVRETFPVSNYVFFDPGSTEISDRYVLITKDRVKAFSEDRLETFTPKNIPGRSARQMIVYYNVLNILGDRMGKNPEAVVRLTGASMEGPDDGLKMAESVKSYLVNIFGIDPSRIKTEGRIKPRIPSEQSNSTGEFDILRGDDRRVSIWSESPSLMLEFQTGPNAPLRPVEVIGVQEAPLDSYISFTTVGGKEPITSWNLEMTDDNGIVQKFGPFTQEKVSIPGKNILNKKPEGNYKVVMIGQTKSGETVRQETSVHMVLWTPPKNEEMMRFSIIYEFNSTDAIKIYEKYLTEVVLPKIPYGGTVIISGYTDDIGDETHNQRLSIDRANDVRDILLKGLANADRTDVKFELYGFGEDQTYSPFENKNPEGRFYNRTVIIDIIPKE
jgi:outer membrane protein OmpA-like peptidoglycan-associated protein